ncbi:MAG: hypothetical protein JNK82_13765 [Myxococcaceae bacterium]|nr:hypothetical protein [Myxococcaceae bacterium]
MALPALADEPKVAVQAEVVHALVAGNTIDPPTLKAMQEALGKKVKYGSLKRLSDAKLNLTSQPTPLKLPNGVDASFAVEGIKDDVATIRVKVPPADATYKLGKKGSLYVQAGAHEGGDLWLVLSPAK